MYAYYNIPESNKTSDLNIVLDNVTLDNVDSEKLLGVIVDKYLTFTYILLGYNLFYVIGIGFRPLVLNQTP